MAREKGMGSLQLEKSGRPSRPYPRTPEQRLRQLERLRRKGLVREDEYAAARQRILAEL